MRSICLMEPVPELTKIQRNELYKSIKEGGLDPAQCDLTQTYEPGEKEMYIEGRQIAQVTHLPSGSAFNIETEIYILKPPWFAHFKEVSKVNYFYRSTIAGEEGSYGSDWPEVLAAARQWAEEVKREFVDLDLWAEIRRGREFFTRAQYQDFANTPFTLGEQAEIARWIQEVKENVREIYSLSIEQAVHIDTRFEEVLDASSRMGRKDWLLLFGGALFSLILSAVIPPEVVQHILITATHSLGHLFSGASPPRLP